MSNFTPDYSTPPWVVENLFYLQLPVSRLARLLAHYDVYKRILGLPGAVVECGVYKGASLMRFATFRALLETSDSRAIHGFDAFGEFPRTSVSGEEDLEFIERFEREGGEGISVEGLYEALARKGLGNVQLHKGLVGTSIPDFLKREPAFRIALLNLDLDVFEPTAECLELLMPRMVRGGIVIFDDYTAVEGATRAAEDFIRSYDLRLEKLPYYHVPAFVTV